MVDDDTGMSSTVTPAKASRQPVLRVWLGLLGTALALHAAHTVLGLGPEGALFEVWLYNAIILAAAGTCVARGLMRRTERPAWLALGAGMVSWSAADVTYAILYGAAAEPPYPSVSDALWLAFYPASYAALLLLVRSRLREFTASLWLDGLIGAFAAAAIAAALVFQPVLASTEGGVGAVATNLAYPLGDLLLIALVVGVFGLGGWRPGREWLLIGIVVVAIADSIYAYEVAVGSYAEGTWLDTLWPASSILLAAAAWSRPTRAPLVLEGWRTLAFPSMFALSALALQVYMFVVGPVRWPSR